MHFLIRDYETRAVLDLKKVGAAKYASHPDSDVLCCAYCVDDGPVKLWVRGDPVPAEWRAAAEDPATAVIAFNNAFERAIETHIMGPRYGWPLIPIERHRCLMARSLALALPGKLETVALALSLSSKKDSDGHLNMMTLARPRKPGKGEPPGLYWHDDHARFERLYSYARQDAAVERELFKRIGLLGDAEQKVWELDARINERGIFIDVHLAKAAIRLAEIVHAEIDAEISALTGGAVPTINCVQKLTEWLNAQGCTVEDIGKETLAQALAREDIPTAARRAIELRLDGAHASANKFKTMLAWRNTDGRVRGALMYHGASTGRWSSHGVQLQNLKRPTAEDLAAAIDAVATGDIAHLRATYPQPMSVLGDVTRATICAAPGHTFFAADYSGIEARVLAWLAGESHELAQWAKFDETGAAADEPYMITGQALGLGRDQGKTATLAFGYMGGVGAYRKLAKDDPASDEEVKRRQQAWRAGHPATVKFWGNINRAAIMAVQKRGKTYKAGAKILFHWGADEFLRMTLPNGRELAYPFPSLTTDPHGELAVVFKDSQAGQWVDCRKGGGAYGGTWTENAVQAVSRDILVAAMPRLEAAGYPIVLHVHDEIVAEVPSGFGAESEFLALVTALPDWAEGLPLAAKFRAGDRFCKIKPVVSAAAPACTVIDDIPPTPVFDAMWPHKPSFLDEHFTPEPREPEYTGKYNSDGYPNSEDKDSYGPHYVYLDANGKQYSRATRMVKDGKKTFRQSYWDGTKWVPKSPAIKIPYRLPELIAAPKSAVFITEGERDADSVAALDLVATTNPGGGIKGAWTRDLNKHFVDRVVYILEDNDATGRAHVEEVAESLRDFAVERRIVAFRELPEHGDVTDWLGRGHTREELLARAKAGRIPGDDFELVMACDIRPENIDWLWTDQLPSNQLEIIAGLPGAGKSQIHCCYTACVTTGQCWPDGANGQGRRNVIMLTAEDTLKDVVVPRLIAAGADLTRVGIFNWVRVDDKKRAFLLGEDLVRLEMAMNKIGDVGLICIDPITAYMGGKVDSHRATDVRHQLGPLKDFAERLNVGLSVVTHPAKSAGANALNWFMGSQAFIAAPRVGHLCVEEVEQDEAGNHRPTGRALYTQPKINIAEKQLSMAYRIIGAIGGTDHRTGLPVKTSQVVWEGKVEISANEAVAAATATTKKDRSGAVPFLMDMLSNGPAPKKLIDERAALRGFSKEQIYRARLKMGAEIFKERGRVDGQFFWCLPQDKPGDAEEA